MLANTKTFFAALMKRLRADCICDIGSRDGDQALLFRDLRPAAKVLAFEANPINYRAMAANSRLTANRVEIFPYAVTNVNGVAEFHVADVDYFAPESNKGISSLLVREDLKIKETVQVQCRRIDDFIMQISPESRQIGLWIDVEGAEFGVLEGMDAIAERVTAVHVEAAEMPMRQGQKTLSDLVKLMDKFGFKLCASNIRKSVGWGDVVFVHRAAIESLGFRFQTCRLKGHLSYWIPVDDLAVALKSRTPRAYSLLRKAYLKIGT
jgi:FkbM family methyltransferase